MASSRWLVCLLGWVPAVAFMGVIFFLSSGPAPDLLQHNIFKMQDKVLHAGAFFVLASLCFRGLLWNGQPTTRSIALAAAGLAILYGATDEWHQSYIPSRTSDLDDWIADVFGALIVVWAHKPLGGLLRWERGLWRALKVQAAFSTRQP